MSINMMNLLRVKLKRYLRKPSIYSGQNLSHLMNKFKRPDLYHKPQKY